jgi:hypothetical protein
MFMSVNLKQENIIMKSEIWGPKYWFVLHSIARTYPENPSDAIQKIYYSWIRNIPLFLPDKSIGKSFGLLLDEYPVTPYLDSRVSLMKWTHYIHNIVNKKLGKERISYNEAMKIHEKVPKRKSPFDYADTGITVGCIGTLLIISYILYKNSSCAMV